MGASCSRNSGGAAIKGASTDDSDGADSATGEWTWFHFKPGAMVMIRHGGDARPVQGPFRVHSVRSNGAVYVEKGGRSKIERVSMRRLVPVLLEGNRCAASSSSSSEQQANLMALSDDVILRIASFVSYAPFEAVEEHSRDERERLMKDYNAKTTHLNELLGKKQATVSPFSAPQQLFRDTFHASSDGASSSLQRVSEPPRFGTLTHVLPLVNRRLGGLCGSRSAECTPLWTEALERVVGTDPTGVWEAGLVGVVAAAASGGRGYGAAAAAAADGNRPERIRALVAKALACETARRGESPVERGAGQELFRKVYVNRPIRLPVYRTRGMRSPNQMGETMTLRLSEPCHRLMLDEVMAHRSDGERKYGFPIAAPRPRFLYSSGRRGAHIVEIRRCQRRGGTAEIMVAVISWEERLKDITKRPESGGLLEATVAGSPI